MDQLICFRRRRVRTLLVEKKEDLRDPRFHILGNEKYDHLPSTLLIVAEFDQLRDESYGRPREAVFRRIIIYE